MSFIKRLEQYSEKNWITEKYREILTDLYGCYASTLKDHDMDMAPYERIFDTYLDLIKEQLKEPFVFAPYHKQILLPFDYYNYGLEFLKPLVDLPHSSLAGIDNIRHIEKELAQGHNVILLANHQIEADPQVISILLEKEFPNIGQNMIFVAGERVLTDPLAIPFSMGRNLLCIYSKKYIDYPQELKTQKQLHNKKTMELMSELLTEGGKCIYVAPSGGRDRPNAEGFVEVAPFDGQSIEMFYLMARRAKTITHFHPLALATYPLLPPPNTIQVALGEERKLQRGAIHAAFGGVIDMDLFPGSDLSDKHERRQARAEFICSLVKQEYSKFPS